MPDNINKKKINDILDSAGAAGKLGSDAEKLKNALNSGSLDSVLNNLKPADAQKLNQVLSNKAMAEQLLNSPKAQKLLKQLLDK